MRQRWFGFFALTSLFGIALIGPGCVALPAPAVDPPEKKTDDSKKDDTKKKEDDEKVGPLRKMLQEMKERREAAKEARLKEKLEKIEKKRDPKDSKDKVPEPQAEKVPERTPADNSLPKEPAKEISLGEWLEKSRAAYAEVKDYTCTFVKRERIGGKLQDEQTAEMTVKTKPYSVFFHFTAPKMVQGQEAAYVSGKNDGKARVKGAGLKGIVGFMTLPPDDPKIMADNRHTIDQSGIGKLIDQIAEADRRARGNSAVKSRITAAELTFEDRECVRLEIATQDGPPELPPKTVIYFDKKLKLPTRIENYELPKKGTGTPELAEMYAYTKLKLNAGVKDEVFDK